jgi:hypothetical protein
MKLALALQILLVAYHQATTLLDFYPFNGARFARLRERLLEAGFNFLLMAPAPIGILLGWSGAIRLAAAYYPILFLCEVATWWVPYVFGASAKWREIYSRVQGRTIGILPRRGDNPAPNLEHLILMALTIGTAAASIAAYRATPGASLAGWPAALLIGAVMVWGVAKTHWKPREACRPTAH